MKILIEADIDNNKLYEMKDRELHDLIIKESKDCFTTLSNATTKEGTAIIQINIMYHRDMYEEDLFKLITTRMGVNEDGKD
jgi:hypothetical protein